jgi:hypothetical protein
MVVLTHQFVGGMYRIFMKLCTAVKSCPHFAIVVVTYVITYVPQVKGAYHEGVDEAKPRDNSSGRTEQHGTFDKEAERHVPPADFTKSTEEMLRGDVNAGA